MKKQIDFLAIGDIVNDIFIRLKDARTACNINNEECTITMKFKEKIPYESATLVTGVGNSPNASVSAARLGLKSALLTCVGGDEDGEHALENLKRNNVDTSLIKIEAEKKTNTHYVLWFESDRTILVNHADYTYEIPDTFDAKWIYLSSLGQNSVPFHNQIAEFLQKNPDTKLAFQPGTFQMSLGTEILKDIYARTEIFFCNKEEAQRILKTTTADVKELLERIHNLGPRIIVITDGPQGAYMREEGGAKWFMPIYPDPKPPLERTGAGDSFASTFTAAIALGKTPVEALTWGPINSMSVVQYIGAQEGLLSRDSIEEFLREAPAYYKASLI